MVLDNPNRSGEELGWGGGAEDRILYSAMIETRHERA